MLLILISAKIFTVSYFGLCYCMNLLVDVTRVNYGLNMPGLVLIGISSLVQQDLVVVIV